MKYTNIGKKVRRIDGVEKVTGEAKFIADLKPPDMLVIKLLRSPHAHAKIKKLDIRAAERLSGVKKVVTGSDCSGLAIFDVNLIAKDKVRFVGETVAAVIAENEEIANEAKDLIKVEYEPLKCVFDVYDAIKKDAPLLHEDMGSNIFHHYKLRKGDIAKGFSKSYLIVENEFSIPHISHTQIEAHGCVGLWGRDGNLELNTSSQAPYIVREFISEMLKISMSKIRVRVPYVGGGFGGKSDVTIEPLVAAISRFIPGRPVGLFLSREEVFCGTMLGRGMRGKIKTGVTKDGKLLAEEITLYFNAGAYSYFCLPIVCGGGQNSSGPYTNKNIKVDSYGVYTNTPFVGAFRGYGHPEGNWMKERQLDIIAKKLGIDNVEIRLKNCWRKNDINHIGQKVQGAQGKLAASIKKTAESIKWGTNLKSKKDKITAKGIACFMKSPVMATNAASSSIIKFNSDGSVNFSIGTIDIGQGSITALSQICAEKLQLPLEKIHLARQTDTNLSAYEWQTVASRGTWSVGNAIISACEDAIKKIKLNAAHFFRVAVSNIIYEKGYLFVKNRPKSKLPLTKFTDGYTHPDGHTEGGPVVGYGYFMPCVENPSPETGQGRVVAEWTGGCQGVVIEIDKNTGEINIVKMVTTIDAGKIINPQLARGQVVGAMVQGLGSALYESIVYSKDGKIRNDHFTDYKIPTPDDVFKTTMDVQFIETIEKGDPYGARCLAEHGIVSIPSAVANAVASGTGIEFFDLPLTCDKVLSNMKGAKIV